MREEFFGMPNSPPAEEVSPQHLSSQQVEEIHRQFGQDLWAFLLGVLKDQNAADDALQQTLQRVSEFGAAARTETMRGWLFQVAFREAMLIRRREQRDSRHQTAWWLAVGRTREQALPDKELMTQEEIARLRLAVASLPPEQRIVVECRIQQQQTFAQIAESLKIPLGTVLTRMRNATQSLRKTLHEQ